MTCNWCRAEQPIGGLTSLTVDGKEMFAHLCAGCYFCWKHGSPRIDEDFPFTQEQQSLKAFTANFFDGLHKLRFA